MEGYGLRIGHQDFRISSCHINIWYIHFCSLIVAKYAILRTLQSSEFQYTVFWGHCRALNFPLEDDLQLFPGLESTKTFVVWPDPDYSLHKLLHCRLRLKREKQLLFTKKSWRSVICLLTVLSTPLFSSSQLIFYFPVQVGTQVCGEEDRALLLWPSIVSHK